VPSEPEQVDGGTFEVGGLEQRRDPLVTFFDGGGYTLDERRTGDPDLLLPAWLEDHDLLVALGGSSPGPAFEATMPVVDLPELLAPTPGSQDPLRPEPDGFFHIEWTPDPEAQVHVYLRFNLDWDESALSCWPAAGAERLRLPPEWIAELTWGAGDLRVTLRRADVLVQGSTQVTFRTRRTVQTGIWFEGY
jgi:hypothetical protein